MAGPDRESRYRRTAPELRSIGFRPVPDRSLQASGLVFFGNEFGLSFRGVARCVLAIPLEEAIRAKELPPSTDPEILIDALYGPQYFRLFLGHAPLDEKFADSIFKLLI
jgi:hypothetical protein